MAPNDYADVLITYLMRRQPGAAAAAPLDDNLDAVCREGLENLLAMQHRDPSNFALRDVHGKRETYAVGAFRYGMSALVKIALAGSGEVKRGSMCQPHSSQATNHGVKTMSAANTSGANATRGRRRGEVLRRA